MFRRTSVVLLSSLAVLTPACVINQGVISTGYPNPTGILGASGGLRATVPQVVLAIGEEKDLTTLLRTAEGVLPATALSWTASNPSVVMLNPNNGQVKALTPGTAIVTGTASTGAAVSIEVSVVEKRLVQSIGLTPSTLLMTRGEMVKVQAQVTLADGQINGNVNWSSSDNTIATVNATTGEVSAVREGKVTIVASYAAEPRYKAIAEVTIVKDKSQAPAPVATATPQGETGTEASPVQTSAPTGTGGLELAGIDIADDLGNEDGIPNRGEPLYIRPIFRNTGLSRTNKLEVALKTTASVDVAQVQTFANAWSRVSVDPVQPGRTSETIAPMALGLKIQRTAEPGTSIPVTFEVTDSFGNAWSLPAKIECAPIANQLEVASVEIEDTLGNEDGIPNRGESLYLRPVFRNTGSSRTNKLEVSLKTTASVDVAQVQTFGNAWSRVSVDPVQPGTTSETIAPMALGLKIQKTAEPGTSIPVTFEVTDSFGNAWSVPYTIQLQ